MSSISALQIGDLSTKIPKEDLDAIINKGIFNRIYTVSSKEIRTMMNKEESHVDTDAEQTEDSEQ